MILFPGRTGSSYLLTSLAQHPDIEAKGEMLGALRARGADVQLEWAERFLRGHPLSTKRAVGFKTKFRDIVDTDRFAALLHTMNTRIVVLNRENDVKHAVSRVNARRLHDVTGHWNREPGDPSLGPVAITPADLEFHLEKVVSEKSDIDAFVARLSRPTITISYEELLTRFQPTLSSLFAFLGVRDLALSGTTQKNTDSDLARAVTNLDELREHFRGSPYEAMFDAAPTAETTGDGR